MNKIKNFILIAILFPFLVNAGECNLAKKVDYYNLAMYWLPAKCKTAKFPECIEASKNLYFTLHGYWPENKDCGKEYSFCGDVKDERKAFCSYPPISMSSMTHAMLMKYMPSVKFDGCLERHEWFKHGSCSPYESDQYYRISVNYLTQFNYSRFVSQFLMTKLGIKIELADLIHHFDSEFGVDAHKNLSLICKNKYLVELRIAIPKDNHDGRLDLRKILHLKQKQNITSNCKTEFIFDR